MGVALEKISQSLDLLKKQKYLVAVSGGCDSVALLHLLQLQGHKNLVVCHLDHQLRGPASTGDAAFVGELARELGFSLESATASIREEAEQSGMSVETAAREARYRFFAECARAHRCNRILLGHHADDQAETVLMNLLRGSSLRGLAGMRSISERKVGRRTLTLLRPLLEVRQSDLLALAKQEQWRFREDASNKDPQHTRNRIRHELLPLAADILRRDPTPAINRLAEHAAGDDGYLRGLAVLALEQARCKEGLDTRFLTELPTPVLQRVLYAWLMGEGIPQLDRSRIGEIAKLLCQSSPAKVNLPGDRHLRRRNSRLFIEPAP